MSAILYERQIELAYEGKRFDDCRRWLLYDCLLYTSPNPGFHEGNSWNYTFYVPHDVYGLAKLMGGKKPFIDKLQDVYKRQIYLCVGIYSAGRCYASCS